MAVNIPKLSNTKVYNYKYDQLNRLVAMDMYNGLNPVAGTFTASSSTEYRERISYDPNGNIGTYQRNGDAARLTMDNLTYSYTPNTNRLHKVVDAAADASAGVYPNYNDLRTGQADNNYVYDAIGNLVQDVKDTITNISWNVYGKIESITKNAALIRYTYDASGNRISKSTAADTTFYVRDASGNVLSVYSKPAGGTIAQEEVHLYGSSRLGIITRHLAPDTSFNAAGDFGKILGVKFTRGEKLFELSNHLGNVLVTLADRVVQVKVTSDTVRHYLADVRSANDYYPFGMLMPGRKFNSGAYRMGFNGHEMSNEIKGVGNSYTAEFWEYDPRLGRRWNLDPKPVVGISEYSVFAGNPIAFSDPLGDTLSNPQLVSAMQIASAEITDAIKNKRGFFEKGTNARLMAAADSYIKKNDLNLGDAADFIGQVDAYHDGLASIGYMSASYFAKLDRSVINNNQLTDFQRLSITIGSIYNSDAQLRGILNISANVALGEAMGGIGTGTGMQRSINPFGANEGYGLFGRDGLRIGKYRIDAMYANPTAGEGAGTLFSLKQMKPGGTLWRWDYGKLHSTGELRIHSTVRFTLRGLKYGSSTQRNWFPTTLKPPFFKPLK